MSTDVKFDRAPRFVDRLIVHQFDPARPSPGGIDSCLRGICRYAPPGLSLAVVGVDVGSGPDGRRIGQWEKHTFDGRAVWFLPVARLDPGNQRRRIPHALRLVAGTLRFRRRLPRSEWIQAHRMDTGVAARFLFFRRNFAYFIHTQESGLTGTTSDSVWRRLGGVHHRLERRNVEVADDVVVFNEEFAATLAKSYPQIRFSPTWYDPAILGAGPREAHVIVWVGRLEIPKDPSLALEAFRRLVANQPDVPWQLHVLGDGTEMPALKSNVKRTSTDAVTLHGRVAPEAVMERLSRASLFLMTSHPGYEGYPRVLVEALASGLPSVVTEGSDTGELIRNGENGWITSRDPEEIAARLAEAHDLKSETARATAELLSAPSVIAEIYREG